MSTTTKTKFAHTLRGAHSGIQLILYGLTRATSDDLDDDNMTRLNVLCIEIKNAAMRLENWASAITAEEQDEEEPADRGQCEHEQMLALVKEALSAMKTEQAVVNAILPDFVTFDEQRELRTARIMEIRAGWEKKCEEVVASNARAESAVAAVNHAALLVVCKEVLAILKTQPEVVHATLPDELSFAEKKALKDQRIVDICTAGRVAMRLLTGLSFDGEDNSPLAQWLRDQGFSSL